VSNQLPGIDQMTQSIVKFCKWVDEHILDLARQVRLSYLPPLLVYMAERSIAYVVGFLTIVGSVLSLPIIGMYYGLHEWTSRLTTDLVDAHFIAIVDTALESPLGQVAMIPMLAWIANSAPSHLKATFFAVMASFTNLALSLSNLGTKYLNRIFTVSREILDPLTDAVTVPADYSELGILLITVTSLGLLFPMLTILFIRKSPSRYRS